MVSVYFLGGCYCKKRWQFILVSVEILGRGLIFLPSQITIIYLYFFFVVCILFCGQLGSFFCGARFANRSFRRPREKKKEFFSVYERGGKNTHSCESLFLYFYPFSTNRLFRSPPPPFFVCLTFDWFNIARRIWFRVCSSGFEMVRKWSICTFFSLSVFIFIVFVTLFSQRDVLFEMASCWIFLSVILDNLV